MTDEAQSLHVLRRQVVRSRRHLPRTQKLHKDAHIYARAPGGRRSGSPHALDSKGLSNDVLSHHRNPLTHTRTLSSDMDTRGCADGAARDQICPRGQKGRAHRYISGGVRQAVPTSPAPAMRRHAVRVRPVAQEPVSFRGRGARGEGGRARRLDVVTERGKVGVRWKRAAGGTLSHPPNLGRRDRKGKRGRAPDLVCFRMVLVVFLS